VIPTANATRVTSPAALPESTKEELDDFDAEGVEAELLVEDDAALEPEATEEVVAAVPFVEVPFIGGVIDPLVEGAAMD